MPKKFCRCGEVLWVGYRWNGLAHVPVIQDNGGHEATHCPGRGEYLRDDEPLSWPPELPWHATGVALALRDVCHGRRCASLQWAVHVGRDVRRYLLEGCSVVLDFEGVEVATSSFIDRAIARPLVELRSDERQPLRIVNATPTIDAIIRREIAHRLGEEVGDD